jgi:enoyl-CoA hydratase
VAVELTRRDEIALLTLNRPDSLNALSFAVLREIGAAFDEIAASDARALVVTGAGPKAFCAGADIRELTGRSLVEQKRGAELGQGVFARLDRLPMPSVAAINGFAFGGGLELALACTFRVASRNAKMGLPEIKLGLIPGYGGSQRLPRLVGRGAALKLLLTGAVIDAREAYRIGLIDELVEAGSDALFARALELARLIASMPPLAVTAAIEAVDRGAELPIEEALALEAAIFGRLCATADKREGTRAFLEKRPPVWSGR